MPPRCVLCWRHGRRDLAGQAGALRRRPVVHVGDHRDPRRCRRARPERTSGDRSVGRPTSRSPRTASRQKVDTFTRVSRGGGIGVGVAWKSPGTDGRRHALTADAASGSLPARRRPTTALVFDHLSSESLRLAQRATLDYMPMTGASSRARRCLRDRPRHPRRAGVYDRPRAGAARRSSGSCRPARPPRSRRRIAPTS